MTGTAKGSAPSEGKADAVLDASVAVASGAAAEAEAETVAAETAAIDGNDPSSSAGGGAALPAAAAEPQLLNEEGGEGNPPSAPKEQEEKVGKEGGENEGATPAVGVQGEEAGSGDEVGEQAAAAAAATTATGSSAIDDSSAPAASAAEEKAVTTGGGEEEQEQVDSADGQPPASEVKEDKEEAAPPSAGSDVDASATADAEDRAAGAEEEEEAPAPPPSTTKETTSAPATTTTSPGKEESAAVADDDDDGARPPAIVPNKSLLDEEEEEDEDVEAEAEIPAKSLLDEEIDKDEEEEEEKERASPPMDPSGDVAPPLSIPNEEERAVGGEILFDRTEESAYCGWDNLRWLSYSGTRTVRCCQPAFRLVESDRKQGFWSRKPGQSYEPRVLAVYDEPNLVLVLRRPAGLDEVRSLLGLPDIAEIDGGDDAVNSYLIVESVADPSFCKLRLSPLTTPTSIAPEGADERRMSCFELITPSESVFLSTVRVRDDTAKRRNEKSFGDSGAFLETSAAETALIKSIVGAEHRREQAKDIGELGVDLSWKHSLVLGTLHSFVVSGDGKALEEAIMNAMSRLLKASRSDEEQVSAELKAGLLPSRIVDELDDNGLSPLYYACARRNVHAANALVAAGARVDGRFGTMDLTLAHVCAQNLDHKTLSTILPVTSPSRLDPNAVDSLGRTPMYLAATEGRTSDAISDETDSSLAVSRCIMALEAWGGQMMVPDPLGPLQHPVGILAGSWSPEELAVVLDHTNFRLPFRDEGSTEDNSSQDVTMSLGALFQYPIHRALLSLRCYDGSYASEDDMAPESRLVRTLRVLLEHGVEPNERCAPQSKDLFWSSEWYGYTPLQVLAAVAMDIQGKAKAAIAAEDEELRKRVGALLEDAAEFLVRNGARPAIDTPSDKRLRRRLDSTGSTRSMGSADEIQDIKEGSTGRSKLRSASKQDMLQALGGSDRLKKAEKEWNDLGAVSASSKADIFKNDKSSFNDTDAFAGDKTCAVCWQEFGKLTNRKHKCRITRTYVCDACSGKRITDEGNVEYRITDGQFLLARVDAAKEENERSKAIAEQEAIDKERAQAEAAAKAENPESKEPANRDSLLGNMIGRATKLLSKDSEEEDATAAEETPAVSNTAAASRAAKAEKVEAEEQANRDSLFGSMVGRAKSKLLGKDDAEEETTAETKAAASSSKVAGLKSTLSETRNALLQRGEKLNSLGEKSAKMNDAAKDFASMAKELRKKTESRGVFW